MRRVSLLASVLLAACAGATPATANPSTPRTAPSTMEAQRAAIDDVGRRAWGAMRAGDPAGLLFDDLDLRSLLDGPAATRISAQRLGIAGRVGDTGSFPGLLEDAEYAGVCVQGAREAGPGGALGLRSPGWVFDRLLVIGRRPTGRRIAAWIEGIWLYTDAGFRALDLERVERPRWEHSDLEIAPCDLSIRDDLPERAR